MSRPLPAESVRSSRLAGARRIIGFVLLWPFWQAAHARAATWSVRRQSAVFLAFAIAGTLARVWAQTGRRNFDFESYMLVSDAVLNGEHPYATGRYNYGPVWFLVLGGLRSVLDDPTHFRLGITVVLTLADLALAYLLWRRGYLLGACLLLVSPVSIAISGQHQQFDNIAVTLALLAVLRIPVHPPSRITGQDWQVVLLLGLSLMTKHVFLILPLWIAIQQRSRIRAAFYLFIPPAMLVLSILPFFLMFPVAVNITVIQYRSANNSPLFSLLTGWSTSPLLADPRLPQLFFIVVMVGLGVLYRRIKPFELTLLYAVALVVFSSAIATQYLAIPMAGVAAFMNLGFAAWLMLASAYVVGSPEGLGLPGFSHLHAVLTDPSALGSFAGLQGLALTLFVGWVLMTIWLLRRQRVQSSEVDLSARTDFELTHETDASR